MSHLGLAFRLAPHRRPGVVLGASESGVDQGAAGQQSVEGGHVPRLAVRCGYEAVAEAVQLDDLLLGHARRVPQDVLARRLLGPPHRLDLLVLQRDLQRLLGVPGVVLEHPERTGLDEEPGPVVLGAELAKVGPDHAEVILARLPLADGVERVGGDWLALAHVPLGVGQIEHSVARHRVRHNMNSLHAGLLEDVGVPLARHPDLAEALEQRYGRLIGHPVHLQRRHQDAVLVQLSNLLGVGETRGGRLQDVAENVEARDGVVDVHQDAVERDRDGPVVVVDDFVHPFLSGLGRALLVDGATKLPEDGAIHLVGEQGVAPRRHLERHGHSRILNGTHHAPGDLSEGEAGLVPRALPDDAVGLAGHLRCRSELVDVDLAVVVKVDRHQTLLMQVVPGLALMSLGDQSPMMYAPSQLARGQRKRSSQ